MTHAVWCSEPGTESHEVCRALLGTVIFNGSALEVRLARHVETPAALLLTLTEHGRAHLMSLNNERLYELMTLLRHGFELMTA